MHINMCFNINFERVYIGIYAVCFPFQIACFSLIQIIYDIH